MIKPTIAMVAGEASGDVLGAGLIRALKARCPDIRVVGVGGDQMVAAGLDCWAPCDRLSVMGFAEVVRHLPDLLRFRRHIQEQILAHGCNIFVGIDAPDFNLGLAKRLRPTGIRCLHYVSPSIWAWRQGRARKIGRSVEEVLTLFPFEPEIYRGHGVAARFVGHPTADELPLDPDRCIQRERLGLPQNKRLLAVLPGSRSGEIERLATIFAYGAAHIVRRFPDVEVVVPIARSALADHILARMSGPLGNSPVHWVNGQGAAVLAAADVAIVASGTAALEALFAKTPAVVGYRISALTYAIVMGFKLMKVDRFSLPNMLAGEDLMPELMQSELTAERVGDAVGRLLLNPRHTDQLRARMRTIHAELAVGASERAADVVLEYLGD